MTEQTTGQNPASTQNPAPQPNAGGGDPQPNPAGQQYTAPATQADLDRIIGDRLARERAKFADYDDVKSKASKYDQQVEAAKTEQQRQADALAAAEKARDEASGQLLRYEVASASGLAAEDVKWLRGSTKEELQASAEEFISRVGSAADLQGARPDARRGPAPDRAQGQGGNIPPVFDADPKAMADRIPRRGF